jgi:uncharacterized protein YigA (DUF484 family)
MSESVIQASDVARYLRDHPDFLGDHPDVLAHLSVPSPHGGRAISLHERQLEVLREKNRNLERRLSELLRNGRDNDNIGERILTWTCGLLLAQDPSGLPDLVTGAMLDTFGVPHVALRVWGVRAEHAALSVAAEVPVEVITLANGLKTPYCGPNADFRAATWLPEGGGATRSIALLPLRRAAGEDSFGLLVLGSPDSERFHSGMGTTFLERIAEIASASLSRLVH